MQTQGKKHVREAVIIAALSSMATGLISWGIDEAKRKVEAARSKKRKRQSK